MVIITKCPICGEYGTFANFKYFRHIKIFGDVLLIPSARKGSVCKDGISRRIKKGE